MQLKELLQSRTVSKASSKRGSILELIVTEVNKEREDVAGYYSEKKKKWVQLKKLAPRAIAIKLAHVKTEDLFDFYQKCLVYGKEKGSFSKCFFGVLK